MLDSVFLILVLLFIKHWYIDFVNQSQEEIKHKGIYLNWLGAKHSLKHGLATAIIFVFMGFGSFSAIALGIIDFTLHYHIDWVKVKYGNNDINSKQFWSHLGLDQLAHYLVYLFLIWLIV